MTTRTADAEIERLMALHPKGFDLSLDRITRLLERLGNPHERIPPAIHIAGTNGKGSATAFARALIEATGRTAHVHTSPHLVNWHERYRLGKESGGELVEDEVFAEAVARVAEANRGETITVFEILTAVMFVLFSEHPADISIVEVGLGGRFDATNVIAKPAVSVIMPIAMDHEAYLGDRIELIAGEKAGIIKSGVPVVIGAQTFEAARAVLVDTAERRNCAVMVYGQDFLAFEEYGRMVFQDQDGLFDLPLPALPGRHQLANAAAAIAAVKTAGFPLSSQQCAAAMKNVSWPGRMQRITQGRLTEFAPSGAELWIDGGHNPEAASAIAETLAGEEERISRQLYLICGMINTKDAVGYFRAFEGIAKRVFTVPVNSSDAGVPNDVLAAQAQEAGLGAEPVASIENALKILANDSDDELPPRIIICGSLYLAGEALDANGTPPK